jgi:hypothetical protein
MKKILYSLFILLTISARLSANRYFELVKENTPEATLLVCYFDKIIKPIYGDQSLAFKKIFKGDDRIAYILYDEKTPLGILVFKKQLSNDFKDLGITGAFELKTLFIIDPEKNSGNGIGTVLLNKCIEEAKQLKAQSIIVTASEKKLESINFFKKKGFKIKAEIMGKYQTGISEFILIKNLAYLN